MEELTRIVTNLSLPIKLGWAVWMVWMAGLAVWYLRATTIGQPSAHAASVPRPSVNLAFGGQRTPRKRRAPDGPLSVTRPPSDLPEITAI